MLLKVLLLIFVINTKTFAEEDGNSKIKSLPKETKAANMGEKPIPSESENTSRYLYEKNIPYGIPVMVPGTNAFILEDGENLFKFQFETGVMSSSVNINPVNDPLLISFLWGGLHKNQTYMMTGIKAYITKQAISDLGLNMTLGLGGRDNNLFSFGPELLFHFSKFGFLAPLFVKAAVSYTKLKNSVVMFDNLFYLKTGGVAFSYGTGIHFATGKYSIITIEYKRSHIIPVSMSVYSYNNDVDIKSDKKGLPLYWNLSMSFGIHI